MSENEGPLEKCTLLRLGCQKHVSDRRKKMHSNAKEAFGYLNSSICMPSGIMWASFKEKATFICTRNKSTNFRNAFTRPRQLIDSSLYTVYALLRFYDSRQPASRIHERSYTLYSLEIKCLAVVGASANFHCITCTRENHQKAPCSSWCNPSCKVSRVVKIEVDRNKGPDHKQGDKSLAQPQYRSIFLPSK